MQSGERVPTDKSRASTYISKEKFNKINDLAASDGLSLSSWLERIIDEHLEETNVLVPIPRHILEELKSLSKESFRPLSAQINMIIIEWLESHAQGLD